MKTVIEYVCEKIIEKHKTITHDQFDNGYFWAMKEIQSLLFKNELVLDFDGFTKKEIKIIWDLLDDSCFTCEGFRELEQKIKYIIDNYFCEHESDGYYHHRFRIPVGREGFQEKSFEEKYLRCVKCRRFYNDNEPQDKII